MDKAIDTIAKLVERFLLPLVLVVGFLLYNKFGNIFDKNKKEKEQEKQEEEQHQDDLVPDYRDPKKAKSDKERKKIILENGEEAKRYKQALYAERIKNCTGFGVDFTRVSKIKQIAQDMRTHKVSLSGTAAQYKKVNHTDMYADVRILLGVDYTQWLAIAGTTK